MFLGTGVVLACFALAFMWVMVNGVVCNIAVSIRACCNAESFMW